MIQNKIQIDSKYVKIMPHVVRGLIEYSKTNNREKNKSRFFIVGNDLEVHFSDGCHVKLGDLDWKPAYSG